MNDNQDLEFNKENCYNELFSIMSNNSSTYSEQLEVCNGVMNLIKTIYQKGVSDGLLIKFKKEL